MVQPVARDAYRDQLHALLPSGRAWPEETGTTLDAARSGHRRTAGGGGPVGLTLA